jgi:hypothetical protein
VADLRVRPRARRDEIVGERDGAVVRIDGLGPEALDRKFSG